MRVLYYHQRVKRLTALLSAPIRIMPRARRDKCKAIKQALEKKLAHAMEKYTRAVEDDADYALFVETDNYCSRH